jgi:hypothetical protein|tara:strand:- start:163 stop:321 length:159 start_codon:yes stop_codon:yes gene_type:complete
MSAKSIYELPTPVLLLDWPAAKRNIDLRRRTGCGHAGGTAAALQESQVHTAD